MGTGGREKEKRIWKKRRHQTWDKSKKKNCFDIYVPSCTSQVHVPQEFKEREKIIKTIKNKSTRNLIHTTLHDCTKNLYDYIFAPLSSIFGLESKDFSIAKLCCLIRFFYTSSCRNTNSFF